MVFGLILTGGFFWILNARPHHPDRLALERYSVLLGGYVILTVICFGGAAMCAMLMVRQARQNYRAAMRQNLEDLVESSLRQHQKPTSGINE